MAKREIPELTRFVLDNSEASSMKASLRDATADMNAFLRTVESSTQALNYYQTSLKKISTAGDYEGLYRQSIMVEKSNSSNVRGALDAKRAEMEVKRGFEYSLREMAVPTVSGYKTLHGKDALKEAQAKLKQEGGDIWREPTKKNPDRTRYFYPFDYADDKNAKSAKSRQLFSGANKLSKDEGAIMQAKAEAQAKREEEKQLAIEKRKDKEDKAKSRKVASGIKKVIGITAIAVEVLRRILTASLQSVAKLDKNAVAGGGVGLTAEETRSYGIADIAHGLSSDATLSALQSIQSMFGDITQLDTDAINKLALVMGSKVGDLAESGIGGEHPEQLLMEVLNSYFDAYKQGKNVVGQTVGREEARMSLTTALESISPEISLLFSRMVEDYKTGAHGNFNTAEDWYKQINTNRSGLTDADMDYAQKLSADYNEILAMVEDFKTSFLLKLTFSFDDLLARIKNSRIGMSATESIELTNKNRDINEDTIAQIDKSFIGINKIGSEDIERGKKSVLSDYSTKKAEAISSDPSGYTYSIEELANIYYGTANTKGKPKYYESLGKDIISNLLLNSDSVELMSTALALQQQKTLAEKQQEEKNTQAITNVATTVPVKAQEIIADNTISKMVKLKENLLVAKNYSDFDSASKELVTKAYGKYLTDNPKEEEKLMSKRGSILHPFKFSAMERRIQDRFSDGTLDENGNKRDYTEEEKYQIKKEEMMQYMLDVNGASTFTGEQVFSDYIKSIIEQLSSSLSDSNTLDIIKESEVKGVKDLSFLNLPDTQLNSLLNMQTKGLDGNAVGMTKENNPTILNVNLYDKEGRKINTLSTGIDFGTTSNQNIGRINTDYVSASS